MRVEGIVVAQLPSGLYQLEVEGPRRITAHPAPGAVRNFVRLLVGDRVEIELSPRDPSRGRVMKRL
jgi:translation initiation factor IF-1